MTAVVPTELFLRSAGAPAERARRRAMISAHPEIRELIGPSPASAVLAVALLAAQLTIAAWVSGHGIWMAVLAAVLIGALLASNLVAMIHEAEHSLIFQRRSSNRLIAIIANAGLVTPSAMPFFHYHRWHHVATGDYRLDVGIPTEFEASWVAGKAWRKALWLAAFPLFQWLRTHKFDAGEPYWNRWMIANFAAQAVVDGAILYCWGWIALAYLALSYALAVGFHPVGTRVVQEHVVVQPGAETNNHVGPSSLIECNFGHHAEHHDFPRVAWHRLPRISRIAPEFYRDTPVFRSRTMLLVRFITDQKWDLRNHAVRQEPH